MVACCIALETTNECVRARQREQHACRLVERIAGRASVTLQAHVYTSRFAESAALGTARCLRRSRPPHGNRYRAIRKILRKQMQRDPFNHGSASALTATFVVRRIARVSAAIRFARITTGAQKTPPVPTGSGAEKNDLISRNQVVLAGRSAAARGLRLCPDGKALTSMYPESKVIEAWPECDAGSGLRLLGEWYGCSGHWAPAGGCRPAAAPLSRRDAKGGSVDRRDTCFTNVRRAG